MQLVVRLAPILVGALVVFAASYYVANGRGSDEAAGSAGAHTSVESAGAFLGREVLAACIEADGPVDTQIFVDTVERIKTRLALRENQDVSRFDGAYAREGCPPHGLTGEPIGRGTMGKLVEEASEYRLFVYVIDEELFQQSFGDVPYAEAGAEHQCSGDACFGVTVALFLTSLDEDVLFRAVTDGLGLVEAAFPLPDDATTPPRSP